MPEQTAAALPSTEVIEQVEASEVRHSADIYTFGDPESVLDRRELCQYFEIWHNNRWYEPPLPVGKLAQTFNMSPYHRSAIGLKINMLVAQQVASRWLGADDFERFAQDFLHMGNGYLEWVPNMAGRLARAGFSPAMHTRVGVQPGTFWFVNGPIGGAFEFEAGRMFHLQQPDVAQEIYGLPEWLAALQSGLLSENATLFRRRYFKNGAHLGFILQINDPLIDNATIEKIEAKLAQGKGAGNFRNMLLWTPGGKKESVQLIPVGEVTAKDDFSNIKNISRDDMLAAHRTPPVLIGVIPQNSSGFGKVSDALDTYYWSEVVPIARRMLRMNGWFGVPVLSFADYVCADGAIIRQVGDGFQRLPAGTR